MRCNSTLTKLIVLSSLALALAACGGVKDANKSNFGKAIQAYLDSQSGLCASIPTNKLPFMLSNKDQWNKPQADALVDAGLLSKRDAEVKVGVFGNRMEPGAEYQITNAGQKAHVAKSSAFFGTQNAFCSGKYALVEVDNFTEPNNMFGVTMSEVKFRYKVKNLDSWAKKESIRAAFKHFESETQGEIKGKAVLILTHNGWVHESLFKE